MAEIIDLATRRIIRAASIRRVGRKATPYAGDPAGALSARAADPVDLLEAARNCVWDQPTLAAAKIDHALIEMRMMREAACGRPTAVRSVLK